MASVVAAEKTSPGEQDTAPGDSFKTCARSLISDLHMAKDAMESTSIRFFFDLFFTFHFCSVLFLFSQALLLSFFFFFFFNIRFQVNCCGEEGENAKNVGFVEKTEGMVRTCPH